MDRFDTDFIDISISVLGKVKGPLPFDVYIRRAANAYTKLFKKGDAVDMDRFRTYEEEKKVRDLFVNIEDYRQYLLYVEQVASDVIADSSTTPPEEVLHVVKEMVSLTMFEMIVNMNIDQQSVGHAAQTIKGCLGVLAQDPKSLVKLFQLMTTHPYVVRHSVSTSLMAILLGKALGLEAQKTLNVIGLGAFLHDIGMSRLPFEPEEKEELTPEEWKMVKEHPQLGKRLLDAVRSVPPEVRMIVMQHHEQPNGAGYPDALHDKEIYYLAKIVAIADSFAALVSKRPFREEAFSATQAIALMKEERGKFDQKMLDTFATIFVPVKKTRN